MCEPVRVTVFLINTEQQVAKSRKLLPCHDTVSAACATFTYFIFID